MECEVQPSVGSRSARRHGVCGNCLQLTGKGITHSCSRSQVRESRGRGLSIQREVVRRRKGNLSMLVGREAEEVQEQIVSVTLKQVVERKGNKLRLKEMGPGGKAGMGKVVTVGSEAVVTPLLSAEVFAEIKKSLVLSKHSVDKLCHILRRNKVKMEPNVRQKLKDINHLLDEEYETVRVKFMVDKIEQEETGEKGLKKDKKGKKKKTGKQIEVLRGLRLEATSAPV